MATDRILRIAYAGSLASYSPGEEKLSFSAKLRNWFWAYQRRNIAFHTRSGYFLFKGIAEFKQKYPELAGRLRVDFWGMIKPGNARQVKQMGISEMVSISGQVSRAESQARLQTYDVLFLPLETGTKEQEPLFIPGKLYGYLEMGKPILALSDESDSARILRDSGLGIICNPHDSTAIADTLATLIRNADSLSGQYRPNKEWMEANFSFAALSEKLAAVFEAALRENKG